MLSILNTVDYEVDMEVSHSDIIQAIQDLKYSQSCGVGGIYAEHLKHCSNLIIPLLYMCFSSLFVHGFLPEAMISVVLVPIVKNKSASICSKSNYRPIALASIVSKVLEKIIYDRIAVYLTTCSNPFGFKAKHSTDMTIYGQGSHKLYNWPTILYPPHYRNGVHHTAEIICLYYGELRDVSENI